MSQSLLPSDTGPSRQGEITRILKTALPLAMYYITEVAMGITDMVIVGRLGSTELAAVGLTANIVVELIVVCFGILSIVGVLSSQALGSDNADHVSNTVGQGLWVALSLSVVSIVLSFWLPDLLVATGQDPQVIVYAGQYLTWMIWVVPFALLFVVLRGFLTVLSLTTVIAFITLPAVLLNLALNYLFVFGSWGFPVMGVAGAGLASILVNMVMLSALVSYILLKPRCREFHVFSHLWRLDLSVWRAIFKLGLPVGMTALLEGGLFLVVGIMMGTLGATWLAANEILFHMIPMAFVVALAIGEAAAVRVAFHVGAGNLDMIRTIVGICLIIGCCVMLASAFTLWFFPDVIAGLFLDIDNPENAKVVEIVVSLASIAAIFQLFDGLQVITAWCLRGLKDTLVPMWIASIGYWVCGLGSGYWLGFVNGYGAVGVWWGLAVGLMMTAILLAFRLLGRLKRLGG